MPKIKNQLLHCLQYLRVAISFLGDFQTKRNRTYYLG